MEDDIIILKNSHTNFESIVAVLVTASIWRLCYTAFTGLLRKKSPEYCSRIIAFLHGLITAFLGINQCFYVDIPFYHPEWRTTYMQSFILALSAGYFIHDLVWCLQYDSKDKLIISHHIYCVIFLTRILYNGVSGAQTTCGLGAMEFTNPLLQARWFIRSEGLYPSVLFLSAETVFLIIYLIIRIVLGTYFMWIIISHPKNDYEFIMFSIIIYVISWMFFVNIVRYVLNKYFVKRKQTEIKVTL